MTKWSHVCFYLHVPCFPRSMEDLWMLIFLYKEKLTSFQSICLSICSFFFNNHFPQKSELHSCSLREYNSAPCKKGIVFAFWIFFISRNTQLKQKGHIEYDGPFTHNKHKFLTKSWVNVITYWSSVLLAKLNSLLLAPDLFIYLNTGNES